MPDPDVVARATVCRRSRRPDLLLVAPVDGETNCTSMNHMSVTGPRLAAHALPDGSFSLPERPAPPSQVDDETELL